MKELSKKEMNLLESEKIYFEYALQVSKTLLLVSGGSGTALLAFLGHMVSLDKMKEASLFWLPVFLFFLSSFFVCLQFAFEYLTQTAVVQRIYYDDIDTQKKCDKYAVIFKNIASACLLSSFISLIVGGAIALHSFKSLVA